VVRVISFAVFNVLPALLKDINILAYIAKKQGNLHPFIYVKN
jgi:hypothetical protein